MLLLNWIVWNWTVFDIETVLRLNWIIIYNCLNSLKKKCFWQLNWVLMLNWIALNRTDYIKMDLALNNLQRLICYKTQQTKQNKTKLTDNLEIRLLRWIRIKGVYEQCRLFSAIHISKAKMRHSCFSILIILECGIVFLRFSWIIRFKLPR